VSRDEREHGSRTSKTRRDVRTSESRDIRVAKEMVIEGKGASIRRPLVTLQ